MACAGAWSEDGFLPIKVSHAASGEIRRWARPISRDAPGPANDTWVIFLRKLSLAFSLDPERLALTYDDDEGDARRTREDIGRDYLERV